MELTSSETMGTEDGRGGFAKCTRRFYQKGGGSPGGHRCSLQWQTESEAAGEGSTGEKEKERGSESMAGAQAKPCWAEPREVQEAGMGIVKPQRR